jgi:hypothetical protein
VGPYGLSVTLTSPLARFSGGPATTLATQGSQRVHKASLSQREDHEAGGKGLDRGRCNHLLSTEARRERSYVPSYCPVAAPNAGLYSGYRPSSRRYSSHYNVLEGQCCAEVGQRLRCYWPSPPPLGWLPLLLPERARASPQCVAVSPSSRTSISRPATALNSCRISLLTGSSREAFTTTQSKTGRATMLCF